jgi:hypothetical protein
MSYELSGLWNLLTQNQKKPLRLIAETGGESIYTAGSLQRAGFNSGSVLQRALLPFEVDISSPGSDSSGGLCFISNAVQNFDREKFRVIWICAILAVLGLAVSITMLKIFYRLNRCFNISRTSPSPFFQRPGRCLKPTAGHATQRDCNSRGGYF